jgi:hypothetical protein
VALLAVKDNLSRTTSVGVDHRTIRELVSYYLDLTAERRSEVDTRIAEEVRGNSRLMEAPTLSIATSLVARARERRASRIP